MLHVHQKGVGICGVYTYEVAETKVAQVIEFRPAASASAAVHDGERVGRPVPSFSTSLEQALQRALAIRQRAQHEYATLEHLLLSLIDDRDAAAVMRACDVDLDLLRDKLTDYLDNELDNLVVDQDGEAPADGRLPARDPSRGGARAVLAAARK